MEGNPASSISQPLKQLDLRLRAQQRAGRPATTTRGRHPELV
jgi:hypothetical protein